MHLAYPKVFFSKQKYFKPYICPKLLKEIDRKFKSKNNGFLQLLEMFFNNNKKNSFEINFFQKFQCKFLNKDR